MFPRFFFILTVAVAYVTANTELSKRLCIKGPTPVTRCGLRDLTTENWKTFNIDAFLFSMINQFGTSDNFPKFILSQLAPKGQESINANFDCSNLEDPSKCKINFVDNPEKDNCVFDGLLGTHCGDFTSPEAGFLAANWIQLYSGLRAHFLAVRQAVDNLQKQNFVNLMVDALSPQKQPIGPAVFGLIADLVVDILPIGGEINAATTFMKKIKLVTKAINKDVKNDGGDIISVLESNKDIDRNAAANKDTLSKQVEAIAVGTQKRMKDLASRAFGKNQDSAMPKENEIKRTVAFLSAYHGIFLNDSPKVDELVPQMEKQIKLWVASQLMNVLGYSANVNRARLEIPIEVGTNKPSDPCAARGGLSGDGGCVEFSIGDRPANDIFALQTRAGIDIGAMVRNANGCPSGRKVDFEKFLDMGDTSKLPDCMFNFPVSSST
ncbi:hypothetical protein NQ176_g3469 [Zarea fungicola]|uniref:Uncharacterized protein n=1 Tax=Zarea fungicola TaxID=93591 RepID=A0ACC1NJH7_9HYPO|nr:hypothetical protein NQ176_g3469 [Lecanicillium fungicola]